MKTSDRFMQDNKHYRAAKIDGFWNFVTRDPGEYVGKHRLYPNKDQHQLWLGCSICADGLRTTS